MVKKLKYPAFADVTPVKITLVSGLDEEGEPIKVGEWSGKCNYSEKSQISVDKDGKKVVLAAVIHICGDIAPSLPAIDGSVEINGITRNIHYASRPRNPDGSVNHTRLELV